MGAELAMERAVTSSLLSPWPWLPFLPFKSNPLPPPLNSCPAPTPQPTTLPSLWASQSAHPDLDTWQVLRSNLNQGP